MTRPIATTLNAKYIHTNLALRLLKSYCEPEQRVMIKEYTIKDPDMNIVSDLYNEQPDVIGFSCYIWNIEKTLAVVSMLKKVLPDTVLILGGPEVSFDADYWMKKHPQVDMIIRGEGEIPFKEVLQEIDHGTADFSRIGGVSYRINNQIRHNPETGNMDIATIPSPYRFEEDLPDLNKRIVYFETSRGCPFRCQFCLSSIEQGVRYFNIDQVKEDLLYLIDHGAKLIKFIDRTFNINREYALEMFAFLIDNHQGCQFQFEITADIMRPEVLSYLNENAPPGIFRFEIGVQSTNDATNLQVDRRQNFNKLSRTVRMIKEGGRIDQHLDLIAGLPEEDYSSFKKTFNDVFELEPEELQLGFLKMLRGTAMRRRADEFSYTYMDHAPYEILSNQDLSFDDVIKIKQVEDILEKYWNKKQLTHTVNYLVKHVFPTPFDFFQKFGDHWEAKGYSKIGHQFEDLFTRLSSFLHEENLPAYEKEIVHSLMKIDYLFHYKQKPPKVWWNNHIADQDAAAYCEHLINHLPDSAPELPRQPRHLLKNGIFIQIPFSWEHYRISQTFINQNQLIYLYYDKQGPKLIPSGAYQFANQTID
ncbi:B12-binding domain-containing radical SAM protein [Salisediminibacterium beveridgei]|uniref:Fe-S oxidoreductase n=1 Tax=Salisediminibacterium beveridgei TaxID=632773 RepID=A0A1D7QWQ5_9BACI|nr:B12-binding domain-containing radical SAM protein [Salisediminibacterium beveridgei]AOM83436.1 Fe-S oxidoreductase [Salisediminibacterium beveridgei]